MTAVQTPSSGGGTVLHVGHSNHTTDSRRKQWPDSCSRWPPQLLDPALSRATVFGVAWRRTRRVLLHNGARPVLQLCKDVSTLFCLRCRGVSDAHACSRPCMSVPRVSCRRRCTSSNQNVSSGTMNRNKKRSPSLHAMTHQWRVFRRHKGLWCNADARAPCFLGDADVNCGAGDPPWLA